MVSGARPSGAPSPGARSTSATGFGAGGTGPSGESAGATQGSVPFAQARMRATLSSGEALSTTTTRRSSPS